MKEEECAANQLKDDKIDCMTHLYCDYVSGLVDFNNIPIMYQKKEYD